MKKNDIYKVTNSIIRQLASSMDTPSGKANLAKLRNSLGRPLSKSIEIWPLIFEKLPEAFISSYEEPSNEENAIIFSLQLYALHQQGRSTSVLCENDQYHNIGKSLRILRTKEDRSSMDRRFNTMITSTDFEELSHHLRHLVSILKAKAPEAKVDYARLSEDLYWFLRGYDENMRLTWAREYYRDFTKTKGEDNE